MSSTRKEAVTRCGWCKKGCHVNRDLLFLVEVLEVSATVRVILVDFTRTIRFINSPVIKSSFSERVWFWLDTERHHSNISQGRYDNYIGY